MILFFIQTKEKETFITDSSLVFPMITSLTLDPDGGRIPVTIWTKSNSQCYNQWVIVNLILSAEYIARWSNYNGINVLISA